MDENRRRRRQERIRLGGEVRLLIDTADGLVTTSGQIIDLSEGGCALRVHVRIEAELTGRIQVTIAGQTLGLPVVTRWVRASSGGFTIGCQFDRPTPEKQYSIRRLMAERRAIAP